MSNFALIALHPEVRSYFHEYTDVQYILIFVVIEVIKAFDFNFYKFINIIFNDLIFHKSIV